MKSLVCRQLISCLMIILLSILNGYAQETRPAGNTGTGFFVKNAKIYDPGGTEFLPLGANGAVYWDPGTADCKRDNVSVDMPAAGCNIIRIVSQTQGAFGWNCNPTDQRDLVNRSVQAKMVPMLEMHDATCSNNAFQTIVNYWTSAVMVQLCQDFEKYMLVNIANEHDFTTFEEWRDTYVSVIQQFRAAGIKNMIVLDAGRNCGQNPEMVQQYALQVLNADPQKNVLFSVHMYQFWRTLDKTFTGWTPPYIVESTLPALKNAGIPIIVGEWGWNSVNENYTAQTLVQVCEQNNIGWCFWSFFDQASKPFYGFIADVCGNTSSGNRTPAGNFLIPYLQSHAQIAPVFNGGGGTPPNTIEAENWTAQSGGTNSTAQPGYTGSGYFDYGGNGSYAEYNNLNVTTAGNYSLTFRYANGSATNRICALTVNGTARGTNNFAVTGSWTNWQMVTFNNIPLNAGNNTVRLTANSANGGPNVDNFSRAAQAPPQTITIQAENFTTQSGGTNATAQTGYTGTGYYDMGGNGTFAEYVFNATAGGSYTISIRYANGGATNRPCNVITNGTTLAGNFAPTGSWTTWVESTSAITLVAGSNTIRIQVTSANGGSNIDRLVISPSSALTSASRAVGIRNLELPEHQEQETMLKLFPNPASGKVRIAGINSPVTIYVSNVSGQLVKTMVSNNGTIDVSGLEKGIYMVRVKSRVFKLIKQ